MDRKKKNWLGDQSVRNYTSKEYIEDGHLQVKVGDKFNGGQYEVQVLCKLGWGQSSTVWLAHDLKNKMNVALKIVKSDSCYKDVAREEINILKLIAKKDPVGKRGVVKILDSFRHEEKKNTYSCIVLEYLGDGLGTLIDYSRDLKGIPLHAIKKICVHILSGLDFLHRELQLVHCQLKPDNILLMSRLDQSANPNVPPPIVPISATLSESGASKGLKRSGEELTKNQGSEKRAKITSQGCEGKKTAEENEVDLKLKRVATIDKQCRLINFGKACWENEISPNVIQSRNYRSPEVILGYSRSYPVDIWSFACICFELATGDLLFDPQSGRKFDKDKDHLALMIELLGSMPTKMALGGRYSWKFFNNKGEWFDKKLHLGDFWPLKFVLREKYDFTNKDADDLGGFLESILKFDPEVRPTAKDLLQHKFLNS